MMRALLSMASYSMFPRSTNLLHLVYQVYSRLASKGMSRTRQMLELVLWVRGMLLLLFANEDQ